MVPDFNPDFAWRVEPSGYFCKLYKGGTGKGWRAEGSWQLTKGRLVFTTTNAPFQDYTWRLEDFKIVRIDDHEMIVLSGDMQERIRRK